MSQKFTVLVDLDGTIVDTAPDLMNAHNYVMKKFGYETKTTEEIRNLVGKGAGALIGRSIWGTAKKEFGKISDKKIKEEMVKDFIDYYGKNIVNESKIIDGVVEFLKWSKQNDISLAVCTNKQEHLAIDLLKKIKIFDYFEYVAGSNTFDYCKPDPRHLTSVIEILQGDIKKLENKLHQNKRKALDFSTSNFSGTYEKELEAYILEDKPKKVKNMIKKYCL